MQDTKRGWRYYKERNKPFTMSMADMVANWISEDHRELIQFKK